jgi:hypothetical protein
VVFDGKSAMTAAPREWVAAQPGVSQAVKDRAVQIALECLR